MGSSERKKKQRMDTIHGPGSQWAGRAASQHVCRIETGNCDETVRDVRMGESLGGGGREGATRGGKMPQSVGKEGQGQSQRTEGTEAGAGRNRGSHGGNRQRRMQGRRRVLVCACTSIMSVSLP